MSQIAFHWAHSSNQILIWVWVWIRGLHWQCSVSRTAAVTGCAFCQHVRCSELVRQERQKRDGVRRKSQLIDSKLRILVFSFWLQGNISCSFNLKLTPMCDRTSCEEEGDVDNMYCMYVGERQSVPEVWYLGRVDLMDLYTCQIIRWLGLPSSFYQGFSSFLPRVLIASDARTNCSPE